MSSGPESTDSSSNLLDAVIESVMQALRAGQPVDLEALAARNASVATEIRQLVPALVLAENLRHESQHGSDATAPSTKASFVPSTADSIETTPPAVSARRGGSVLIGTPGEVEDELLFAAMALQCELISPEQFLSAFELWQGDRQQSLKQILFDQQPLLKDTQNVIDELLTPDNRSDLQNTEGATHVYTPGDNVGSSGTAARTSASSDLSGTRFQILRPLDRGGLGIVSVALDKELNREVAIKEIRDDRADDRFLRQKFLLEAEVTGGLEHPGIVPIYGLGKSARGRPYYAMRLIRGNNLQSHIQSFHKQVANGECPFDGQALRKLLRRFIDICEAIDYAHSRGVLHRDIKPVNVMLGRYGETLVVDWGLAKALGASNDNSSTHRTHVVKDAVRAGDESESPLVPSGSYDSETRDGSIIGTPAYASPEQVGGHLSEVGIRSDVYGLGATLYELLCGQPPARGSLIELTRQVINGQIVPPRSVNPQVPKALDAVCRKAMSRQPEDRYASASQLRAEIESWLDDAPVDAMPEPFWSHCRRWIRKHPTLASTISAVVCMSILGVSAFALMVARNNASLARLNRELDTTNRELVQSNTREKEARETAQEQSALAQTQSELALSTLNAVVNDIQTGLKALPGGSNARRRLAETVMPRLEKVAQNAAMQSAINRSTLRSLIELSTIVLQMGADTAPTAKGTPSIARLTTSNAKSAAKIAQATLERALAIALQLMEQAPTNAKAKLDYIDCCFELGNITTRLGQQDAAVGHFETALKTAEKLVETNPTRTEFLQTQARMQMHLGDCIVRSKRVDDAIKLYEPALTTLRKLSADAPADIGHRRLLSIGLQFLGDAHEIKSELLDALRAYEEAVQLRKQITLVDGRPQYVRELAYAMGKVAYNQQLRAEIQQSIETTAQTIRLLQDAAALDPQDTWLQSELASNLDLQSKLNRRAGKIEDALKNCYDAISIREALCSRDSSDVSWKRNLSVAYDNLAQLLTTQGDLDKALEPLNKSLDIARELATGDPSNAVKQRDVAISLEHIGKLFLKKSQPEQALPLFEDSLRMMKQLAEADPANANKQRDWMVGFSYVADAYLAMDRPSDALPLYQQGLGLARKACEDRPQAIDLKRDLGIWLSLVISVHQQLSDPAAALEPALEAVELNRVLAAIDEKDTRASMDYAKALREAGATLGQVSRFDEAQRMLASSIEIMHKLHMADLQNADTQDDLATTHTTYGDLLARQDQLAKSAVEYLESQQLFEQLVSDKPLNVLWRKSWVETSRKLASVLAKQDQSKEARKLNESILAFLDSMIAKDQATDWSKTQRESVAEEIATVESR